MDLLLWLWQRFDPAGTSLVLGAVWAAFSWTRSALLESHEAEVRALKSGHDARESSLRAEVSELKRVVNRDLRDHLIERAETAERAAGEAEAALDQVTQDARRAAADLAAREAELMEATGALCSAESARDRDGQELGRLQGVVEQLQQEVQRSKRRERELRELKEGTDRAWEEATGRRDSVAQALIRDEDEFGWPGFFYVVPARLSGTKGEKVWQPEVRKHTTAPNIFYWGDVRNTALLATPTPIVGLEPLDTAALARQAELRGIPLRVLLNTWNSNGMGEAVPEKFRRGWTPPPSEQDGPAQGS